MWSFTSYLGRARPPPLSSYYGVSVTEQKLFSLGSVYLLPQSQCLGGEWCHFLRRETQEEDQVWAGLWGGK